ncbi:ATP-binding cassette domain-containing protein [Phycicoccus sp. CSK15P-2]|uniref:multiple monosaccharide ABC transporter ATP-binding protein n=1 Tax=Phycicoccus sp. CSK15P-2 TaxID=2807627 RepID=UPI00194E46BB|nr:multiple monosaccharide ABC transporter ATP-binding protein [Phycicoccus sp. CSK15P-2]MBM6404708.1 ATP-binding cassette domain-containing protein [Phycicoccus sp. CSK15P-2]
MSDDAPARTGKSSASGDVILEMRHITKEFPGVKALDEVDMVVRRGEIHAICGENGAGKSTLMKVLSGLYPLGSYEGEIHFEGELARFHTIRDSEHSGIVIIHQELALIPELSIAENIFLGNEQTHRGSIDWVTTRAKAAQLLERVGLHEDPTTRIKDIGVGKQQLVEIAKALSKDVRLLILDEPTAALNESDSQHLLEIMSGLRQDGVTCIMISHKLNEIEQISDAITIIRDGRTIETLRVHEDGVDENRIIRGMVGRDLGSRFPEHTPDIGEVFFEVKDWRVQHPVRADRLVCKDASFFVRRGEIVGFAGLMGAGRTELMRSVFGRSYGNLLGGTIVKDGQELRLGHVRDAIDAGLAYVTEDRKSLGLNLLDDIKTTTVSAKLSRITEGLVVNEALEFRYAEQYRKELRTKTPDVEEGVAKLSGGNQQKVVLAKWLFTEPDLLILDEPTRGIDVGAKFEIYGIIQRLASEGKGVIVVSSELPELLGLSDRIYTICEGEITGCLDKGEANQESLMRLMTTTTNGRSETPAAS